MTTAILCCTGVLLLWALFSRALQRWRITAPMVMVIGGMVIALASQFGFGPPDFDLQVVEAVLTGGTAQRIAEVILALVLFTDSFEIRQGVFGHEPRLVLRLLFVALPLSIVAAMGLGVWAFPEMSMAAVLALVCAVVPTDFAPAGHVLKDARFPERVRNVLNVESGYNDGIVAPIFLFALTLAGSTSHASTPEQALDEAFPASLKAIAIGVLIGVVAGLLKRWTAHRDWTSSSALRVGVLCIPLITYAAAAQVHGNGFVAAFVAGLAFRAARGEVAHSEAVLTEDVGLLASYVLWFVLGVFSVLALEVLLSWQVLLFSLAALTIVRIVPVLFALFGSSLNRRDRLVVAVLGPRGIATLVFGLLAYADLRENEQLTVLAVMVVTVLGSFVLHGLGAPLVAKVYTRDAERAAPTA